MNSADRIGPNAPGRASIADLVLIGLILWQASYVDQFIFRSGGPPPLYVQLGTIGIFAAIFLLRAIGGAGIWQLRSHRFRFYSAALAFYAIWTIASYLMSSQSEIASEVFVGRMKVILFTLMFAYALDHPRVAKQFFIGCVVLATLGAILNIYDFLSGVFTTVRGRAAGFYLNPTISGFMIVTLAIVGIRVLPSFLRYAFWALICCGVFLTFSRGAWLYIIIATVGLAALGYFGLGRVRYAFAACILAVVGFVGVELVSGRFYQTIAASPLSDYLDRNTIGRIGGLGAISDDYATTERRDAVELGWQRFSESPLFGHGLGSTHEWEQRSSTHNMYVLFLAEGGIIGLLVYLGLLYVLVAGASDVRLLLGLIVLVSGFFTHNLLDAMGEAVILSALATAPLGRLKGGRQTLHIDRGAR